MCCNLSRHIPDTLCSNERPKYSIEFRSLKKMLWGQRDSAMGKVLVLLPADLGMIPGTIYGALSDT